MTPDFCDWVNQDIERAFLERSARYLDVMQNGGEGIATVTPQTPCRIVTRKKKFQPSFFIQSGFLVPKRDPVQILEVNPNKMPNGREDLEVLVDWIFGSAEELKISRIDLNADLEAPVDSFFRCLRIPYKRKSTKYSESRSRTVQVHGNCGITGLVVGASPAQLRVYDKIQEQRVRRQPVDHLPPVLTRFEFQLRHKKCPIWNLSQLEKLLDYKPFDSLQFLEASTDYDFRTDSTSSKNRYLFNNLQKDYGTQEAIRILNRNRHFKRDIAPFLLEQHTIKRELQESYLSGVRSFLSNQGAEI